MEIPDVLRARMEEPRPPAIEHVRLFLLTTVADALSLDEVRADAARTARVNREPVRRDAVAIETLLAESHPPGTLSVLVAWYANWVLTDDTSDADAAAWLADLASILREVLDEVDR
ncbi:hypothetical protein [Amycolatopsis sp. WAC 01416]|uniref:hypothetical protein n=1 Tax=Amycolatopsis sp. WAC 01416 TaxID=2203196 RepID=UPI0018F5B05A|nr:hypothetical protein [Amycolatopsis sp. WAC 01416]